ncbi:hypothetical protein BH10PAT1_BH10PAT1_4060 [soil metagenome]
MSEGSNNDIPNSDPSRDLVWVDLSTGQPTNDTDAKGMFVHKSLVGTGNQYHPADSLPHIPNQPSDPNRKIIIEDPVQIFTPPLAAPQTEKPSFVNRVNKFFRTKK